MESTQSIRRPNRGVSHYLLRAVVVFTSALAVLSAGAVFLVLGTRLLYNQRAYPGVSLNGVSLGGKNQQQMVEELEPLFPYPQSGTLILSDGDQNWMYTPADLGVSIEVKSSQAVVTPAGGEECDPDLVDIYQEQMQCTEYEVVEGTLQ